jgi:HEPN domain-containing protein
MPHDPARVADTKPWLLKADEDLRAGANQLSSNPPYLADAVFHAQQACEKAMKGFLAWHDRPFGKTHNLVELGRACASVDAMPAASPSGHHYSITATRVVRWFAPWVSRTQ